MKISDLKPGTGNATIEAEVVGVEAPREINKMGRVLREANATLSDETGTIELVVWNEKIALVKEGARIRVENGYVNSWQNKPQLTLGKFGKLTVIP